MNVSLTPELEKLIGDKVESGMYQTASEVVREGLRLLHERDVMREEKLKDLRGKIQVGLDQLERGEGVPFDETLLEDIKRRGRERLAVRQRAK